MTWPAVLLWILMVGGLLSRGPFLIYLFGVCGCFGSMQMLPGESLGGINVLPQSACAALLVCKVFAQRGNVLRAIAVAIDPARGGLLTGFFLYSLLTGLTLPRIFEGQIEVVPVSGGSVLGTTILMPSSGNLTQAAYLTLTVLTIVAFAILGSREDFRRHYLLSILFSGTALIATGLADLLTASFGLSSWLEPFRNASFSLLTDNLVLGSKRVVGLTPEASVFGSNCVLALGFLALARPCFDPRWRRTVVPFMIAGLLIMAALSTSSGTYIGLAVFLVTFGVNWIIRFSSPQALAREHLQAELLILITAAFALFSIVVLAPTVLDPVADMIDYMVFQKTSSDSYFVRSMWTRVGWEAFLSTHFLGVGFGGLRTSNWFVSILGSTGLVGGLSIFGFMIQANCLPSAPRNVREIEFRRAVRLTLVPWLVMIWLSGTIPDIGVAAASLYGLLIATTGRQPQPVDREVDKLHRAAA